MSSSSNRLFASIFSTLSVPFTPRLSHSIPTHEIAAETTVSFTTLYRRGLDAFPDELLYEIFLDIVVAGFEARDADGFTGGCAPWNIAAVCSNWRRVCLFHPKLWSYIAIGSHDVFSGTSPGECDGYDGAAVVRTCLQLERSSNHPLHIDVDMGCDSEYLCRCSLSMLRAAGQECHRWKWLFVENWGIDMVDDWPAILPPTPKAPQIEHIGWRANIDDGVFLCPFSELTSLRSAKLMWFQRSIDNLFPWNQLTKLDFEDFNGSLDPLLDILSQCTALTNLRFDTDEKTRGPADNYEVTTHNPDSVILPNITILDIRGAGQAPVTLLPCLRLPNLHKLFFNQAGVPPEVLSDFVQRSRCTLTDLRVGIDGCRPDISFLRLMSNLESLSIRDPRLLQERAGDVEIQNQERCGDQVLKCLTVHEGSSTLCPHLQKLELYEIQFDPVLMVQMVDSRQEQPKRSSVHPLASITISIAHVQAQHDRHKAFYKRVLEECLRQHTEKGFRLCLLS